MPDDFDRAAEIEQAQRQRALDAQRARSDFDKPSLTVCEACEEEIPPARQALGGVTRCVPCQEQFEKWGR